jgi:UDP-N-acetylglucosamine acyltransferase
MLVFVRSDAYAFLAVVAQVAAAAGIVPALAAAGAAVARLVVATSLCVSAAVPSICAVGAQTLVGSNNYVMSGGHFGHDVVVGNNCIFANGAMLGGHVEVEDRAFVSGAVAVHQFCRIGRLAMVGGHARVVQDVPPYMLVDGQSGSIVGLNVVGLRRSGHSSEDITDLKAAYRVIYRRGLAWKDVLETLRLEFSAGPVLHLRDFLGSGKRGFSQEAYGW